MNSQIKIDGMHCQSCTQKIHAALMSIEGVRNVAVSLANNQADIESDSQLDFDRLQVAVGRQGDYSIRQHSNGRPAEGHQSDQVDSNNDQSGTSWLATYRPLLVITAYLIGGMLLAATLTGTWTAMAMMSVFMGLFFVVFSFFKMLDIVGFANAYSSYDIVAARWRPYGFIYPFIELGLGVSYLTGFAPFVTNLVTLIVMTVSTIGVVGAVMRGGKIQCGCLGTMFDLPMSTVTIVEDTAMALMAAAMLAMRFW